jgi:glucose/arabinose dehydrogenase
VTRTIEDFLTGFLIDNDHPFGRVAGLAVDAEGAILVSEDSNGLIYRVAYDQDRRVHTRAR